VVERSTRRHARDSHGNVGILQAYTACERSL
jgi:hypothetical protein